MNREQTLLAALHFATAYVQKAVADGLMEDCAVPASLALARLRAVLGGQEDGAGARFELQQDEETGRLYWWGSEDGWKDATEVGENGVLTLDGQHFAVGSRLILTEPWMRG